LVLVSYVAALTYQTTESHNHEGHNVYI
jgi:hypothetical protein